MFIPQRQYYPTTDQRYQQSLSLSGAKCDTALCGGQVTQLTPCASENATNRPHAAPYQAVLRLPSQTGQSQRAYQDAEEKGVYQVDSDAMEQQLEDFHTMFEPEEKELNLFRRGFQ